MKLTHLKTQSGFSLVELMIVIVIIGILSGIAIPSVSYYIQKAKVSEFTPIAEEIFNKQILYFSSLDCGPAATCFVNTVTEPGCPIGKDKCATTINDFKNEASWTSLGYIPTSTLYGAYWTGSQMAANGFIVSGQFDVDGDGNPSVYQTNVTYDSAAHSFKKEPQTPTGDTP